MSVRAARRIPDLLPGDPTWVKMMTASKVSAVLGLSAWESRFSLWHRLVGSIPHQEGNARTQRGNYLEDAVCRWFADQRTDLRIGKTGSWVNKQRPWQSATPDRILFEGRKAIGVLEAKTSGDWEGYGPDGTDEIPPGYRCQILWQLDTLGLSVGYLAVLLPRLSFRAYTIRPEPGEFDWIRSEVQDFLATLPSSDCRNCGDRAEDHDEAGHCLGEGRCECLDYEPRPGTPPPLDAHDATYEAVRALHSDIEERDFEIDPELAHRFIDAVRAFKLSETVTQTVKTEVLAAMGTTKRAVLSREGLDPIVIATRQAKGSNNPYVAAPRKLPELERI